MYLHSIGFWPSSTYIGTSFKARVTKNILYRCIQGLEFAWSLRVWEYWTLSAQTPNEAFFYRDHLFYAWALSKECL